MRRLASFITSRRPQSRQPQSRQSRTGVSPHRLCTAAICRTVMLVMCAFSAMTVSGTRSTTAFGDAPCCDAVEVDRPFFVPPVPPALSDRPALFVPPQKTLSTPPIPTQTIPRRPTPRRPTQTAPLFPSQMPPLELPTSTLSAPAMIVDDPTSGQQLERLRQQLERLKAMPRSLPTPQSPPSSQSIPVSTSPVMTSPVEEVAETGGDEPSESAPEWPRDMTAETGAALETSPVATSETSIPLHAPDLEWQPVADGPVDRRALANNLFAAGDVAAAYKIYQTIANSEEGGRQETARLLWQEYQLANCERRLGDLSSARQRYRRLAAESKSTAIVLSARWWLDSIAEREQLQKTFDHSRNFIHSLEVTIHDELDAQP